MSYQPFHRLRLPLVRRASGLVSFLLTVFLLAGCGASQAAALPTPDLEILAPTATGVTARVEVVIVVVTATAPATVGATASDSAPAADPPAATPVPEATAASDAPAAASGATPAPTPGAPAGEASEQQANSQGGSAEAGNAGNAQEGAAQPQAMSNQQLINDGEEIYATECASCHQLNGEGTDIYPALNQSGVLANSDPTQAIQIVLYGRGEMPAFEDTLSNQQIAAVLSYERNAWQNNHSVVQVAQVRQVRQGGSASSTQPTAAPADASGEAAPTQAATPAATALATAEPAAAESPAALTQATAAPTMTTAPEPAATSGEDAASAAGAQDEAALLDQGEQIYATECASCHQLSGAGNTTYPALNGSALLTAEDPTAAIRLVLYGQGEMPAFIDLLSSAEIAAVISHERNAWDNNASVVSVAQVEEVKRASQEAPTASEAEPTATASDTLTTTATTTATATVMATGTVTTTPTPESTTTPSGDAGGPAVSLTWTPAREVTPLLPTAELSATEGTTTPEATATITGTPAMTATVNVTNTAPPTSTITPTSAAATPASATPAADAGPADGASAAAGQELISQGEAIYARECASCHQLNGEGTSSYPALTGSDLLTAEDPTAAITLVLQGRGEMPAFADVLANEEIAAVLSHERNAWDNNAAVVTVAQVEQARGN